MGLSSGQGWVFGEKMEGQGLEGVRRVMERFSLLSRVTSFSLSKDLKNFLFIFGCVGSSLLRVGFL